METAGYGLIETMRVREGRIPFLERHLARLDRSLRALGRKSCLLSSYFTFCYRPKPSTGT